MIKLQLSLDNISEINKSASRGIQYRTTLNVKIKGVSPDDFDAATRSALEDQFRVDGEAVPETLDLLIAIEGCLCYRDADGNLRFSPPLHNIRNPGGRTVAYNLVRITKDLERWLRARVARSKYASKIGEGSSYSRKGAAVAETAEKYPDFERELTDEL